MNNFIISLIITTIAGISTLFGGFIPFLNIKNSERVIVVSLSFAAGVMMAISILDLLPSSFKYLYKDNLFLVLGLIFTSFMIGGLFFLFIDRFFETKVDGLYRVGIFSMIAIILHNIPEGIITFILSVSDVKLGLFLGLSIALHNIPEGISIMVPIYYGTGSFKKAFFYTLIAGLSEVIGGVVFYLLLGHYINDFMLGILFSFISGVMIYLSFCELLPKSLKYKSNNLSISFFMIGIVFFLLIYLFIH